MKEYLIETNRHNGGIQKVYKFPNGYGASVIQHRGSYGYQKGLWEVAFMDVDTRDFVDPPLDFLSEYYNPDPGIYGSLNDPDVDRCHKSLSLISNYIGEH